MAKKIKLTKKENAAFNNILAMPKADMMTHFGMKKKVMYEFLKIVCVIAASTKKLTLGELEKFNRYLNINSIGGIKLDWNSNFEEAYTVSIELNPLAMDFIITIFGDKQMSVVERIER